MRLPISGMPLLTSMPLNRYLTSNLPLTVISLVMVKLEVKSYHGGIPFLHSEAQE